MSLLNVFSGIAKNFIDQTKNQNWKNHNSSELLADKKEKPKGLLAKNDPLFLLPVMTPVITSPYGYRSIKKDGKTSVVWHNGVDYSGASNKVAIACARCHVSKILLPDYKYPVKFRWTPTGFETIPGIPEGRAWTPYIVLDCVDDPTLRFVYRHVKALVVVGDVVEPGKEIAEIGNYGYSMGAHLHFEYLLNGKECDGDKLLRGKMK